MFCIFSRCAAVPGTDLRALGSRAKIVGHEGEKDTGKGSKGEVQNEQCQKWALRVHPGGGGGSCNRSHRKAPEKDIWGSGGPIEPLFQTSPPGGGLQGPALFFPCFSCIFYDKTAGNVTVCPCPCHCHYVTPRAGGAPPIVVSRSNTSLPPPPAPHEQVGAKILLPSAVHLEERLTVSQSVRQSGKQSVRQSVGQAGRQTGQTETHSLGFFRGGLG